MSVSGDFDGLRAAQTMSAPFRNLPNGLLGSYEEWDHLCRDWEVLAENWFPLLSERLGAKALELAADAFAQQRDPYGTPWKPSLRVSGIRRRYGRTGSLSVANMGTGLTLVKSGDLLLSLTEMHEGTWFAIKSPLPYTNIQNYGWPEGANHPPPPLPGKNGTEGSRAFLPSENIWGSWQEPFERETDDLFRSFFS